MTQPTPWSTLTSTALAALLSLGTGVTVAGEASAFIVTDADFYPRNPAKEALGRLLFFDKILSGNRNISCATCHHPFTATSDGLSLPLGAGGVGLGPTRRPEAGERGVVERVPRNAPALFNLGAREFRVLFHDGRLVADPAPLGKIHALDGIPLPAGLDNLLAAQAMQPVISLLEMAGEPATNEVADAVVADRLVGPNGAWDLLAQRLRNLSGYADLFQAAYPAIREAKDISFVHAANALAAFQSAAFRCTESVFDQAVRGDQTIASPKAFSGAMLFYGKAGCATCHSGPFQTDHGFHAIGVPQIGPGRGDNQPGFADGHDDFGREQATRNPADRFRFRTPSLRQVAMTGPWGHDGAYNDLEQMLRHHLDPAKALEDYDKGQAVLPSREDLDAFDFQVQSDSERRRAIAERSELAPLALTEAEIAELMEFLRALTDPNCLDLRRLIPAQVPSGLQVFD